MSRPRKSSHHQQQQLFDLESEQSEKVLQETLILDDLQNWQPDENAEFDEPDSAPAAPAVSPQTKHHYLIWLVTLLVAVIAVIESVQFFNEEWHRAPFVAGLYGALFLLIGGGCFTTLFSVWRRSALLQNVAVRRDLAQTIHDGEKCDDVIAFCQRMLPADLDEPMSHAMQNWRLQLSDHHTDKEVLTLFEQQVLSKLDKRAKRVIARWSSEAAVLIAISPLAAIDMLLISWRNVKMIDEVAEIYGIELGFVSRWSLIKSVLLNVIYAGISETLSDVGLQALGADMTGKLSGRVAQGMGAGLLTARLGVKAAQLCRPLAFIDEPPLRVRGVAGEIFAALKKRAIG
jgi:putative membrane protein